MDETTKLLNERQKTHGDFDEFSAKYQELCQACSENFKKRTARQNTAIDMICNKLARIITGDADFHDHWDDIKGYAQLGKQGHIPTTVLNTLNTITVTGYNDSDHGNFKNGGPYNEDSDV